MKSAVLLLLCVFSWGWVRAQTLLVSDIDDTIKISHVLESVDSAFNAPKTENLFLGMSAVYRRILKADSWTRFAYVTNAPKLVMEGFHASFLRHHKFPQGELLLRESLNDKNFKITTIRRLISEQWPQKIILVGDNGEQDSLVYAQIKKEYPKIPLYTFIHQVYSTKSEDQAGHGLEPGQIGFVTSIDLAITLVQMKLISQADLNSLVQQKVPQILDEGWGESSGELAFPEWLDCRDYLGVGEPFLPVWFARFSAFRWPWELSPLSRDLIQEFHKKLALRCSTHAVAQ